MSIKLFLTIPIHWFFPFPKCVLKSTLLSLCSSLHITLNSFHKQALILSSPYNSRHHGHTMRKNSLQPEKTYRLSGEKALQAGTILFSKNKFIYINREVNLCYTALVFQDFLEDSILIKLLLISKIG